jgi:hypothetical protein
MSLDHVAVDQGGVAGIKPFRYSLVALEIGEAFAEENLLFNFEAVFFEMADPAIATVSGRGLVDCDTRRRGFRLPMTGDR